MVNYLPPGPFPLQTQRTYEQHLMSLGTHDRPRCPEHRIEIYHNLRGMIRAWKRYPQEEVDFAVMAEMEKRGESYAKLASANPEQLEKWWDIFNLFGDRKAVDVGEGKQGADIALEGTRGTAVVK